jgi:hypothetical protein
LIAWSRVAVAGLLISLTVALVGILSLPYTMTSPVWLIDIEHESTWDVMLTEEDPIQDINLFTDFRFSIEYLRTNGSPITIELYSIREEGAIVSIRNVTEISGGPLVFLHSANPDINRCSLKREANDTSVTIQFAVVGHYVSTDIFYSWIHPFSLLGLGLAYFSLRKLSARRNYRSMVLVVLFAIIASALMTPLYLYFYNGDYHLITNQVSNDIEAMHFELNSSAPVKSLNVPIDVVTDTQWLRIEVYTQNASVLSRFVALNGSDVLILNNFTVAAPNCFGFDISDTNSADLILSLEMIGTESDIDVTFLTVVEVVEPQVDSGYPSALFRLGLVCLAIGIVCVLMPINVPTESLLRN